MLGDVFMAVTLSIPSRTFTHEASASISSNLARPEVNGFESRIRGGGTKRRPVFHRSGGGTTDDKRLRRALKLGELRIEGQVEGSRKGKRWIESGSTEGETEGRAAATETKETRKSDKGDMTLARDRDGRGRKIRK